MNNQGRLSGIIPCVVRIDGETLTRKDAANATTTQKKLCDQFCYILFISQVGTIDIVEMEAASPSV